MTLMNEFAGTGMKPGELNLIMAGTNTGKSKIMDDNDAIVEKINKLSSDAYYLCGLQNFGTVMMGKPFLMAINQNADEKSVERQENAWNELLEAGFCHVDVERGVCGYRSTLHGQIACSFIRQHNENQRKDGILG